MKILTLFIASMITPAMAGDGIDASFIGYINKDNTMPYLQIAFDGNENYQFMHRFRPGDFKPDFSCLPAVKQVNTGQIELECDDGIDRVAVEIDENSIIFAGVRMFREGEAE